VLKKLLVWVSVLVVAAVLAVPAFAQTTSDLTEVWGSDQWLMNQFGANGDISGFCETVGQDPEKLAGWLAQFPNLAGLCSWSPSQGTPQQPQGSSQPQTPPQQESSPPQSSPSQTQTSNG